MSQCHQIAACAENILALETPQNHTRCSGCGNYGILNALMRAIALEGIERHRMVLVNDVGCNGNVSDKILTNTLHGLHGRSLPLACGVHLANPTLPVIVMAGDGATMSEGVNHLIHTARNNFNITFLLHNNFNYGLTTGQASATTPKGSVMKATIGEVTAEPLTPAKLVLAAGGTFVARGYSGNVDQLTDLIRAGIQHQGFSFVEILQLCPTYSKATPAQRYETKVYDVDASHDTTDSYAAMRLAENMDRLATGILYRNDAVNDFYSLQPQRQGVSTTLAEEVELQEVSELLEEWKIMSN